MITRAARRQQEDQSVVGVVMTEAKGWAQDLRKVVAGGFYKLKKVRTSRILRE